MKITKDMVMVFNNELERENCCIRLKYQEMVMPSCEIVIENEKYVESYIINPTKEFRNRIIDFFKERGITINSNNTGSIFWSNEMVGGNK